MILWSLESAALALSIFVTVMLLWLGLTVWLNGERGSRSCSFGRRDCWPRPCFSSATP